MNGSAWIQTAVGKVDFLYRNLDQVRVAAFCEVDAAEREALFGNEAGR